MLFKYTTIATTHDSGLILVLLGATYGTILCWLWTSSRLYVGGMSTLLNSFLLLSAWCRKKALYDTIAIAHTHIYAVQIHYNGDNTRLGIDFDFTVSCWLALDEQPVRWYWCTSERSYFEFEDVFAWCWCRMHFEIVIAHVHACYSNSEFVGVITWCKMH